MIRVNPYLIFLIVLVCSSTTNAQNFIGFRAGVNVSQSVFEPEYKEFNKSYFVPGFTAGPVFAVQAKDKYALKIEALITQKGRKVKSTDTEFKSNRATYYFADFPVMFQMKFNAGGFSWYLTAGPEINYWFGGKGYFEVYDANADQFTRYQYKLHFGNDSKELDVLNIEESNRILFSINFGGGVIYPLTAEDDLYFDLRFALGHSNMAEVPNSAYIQPLQIYDNYFSTINSITFSVIYTTDIYKKTRKLKRKFSR